MTKVSKNISYVLRTPETGLQGHLGGVNALQCSRDFLFSAGRDGTVKLWAGPKHQPVEGKPFSSFKDFANFDSNNIARQQLEEAISSVGITGNPAGQRTLQALKQLHTDWINDIQLLGPNALVSGSSDLQVKYWDYKNDKVTTLGHHNDYVQCLASGPSWIASGGLDRRVVTWDVARAQRQAEYSFQDLVYSLAASEATIAVGGTENSISLIDVRAGSSVLKLVGHTDIVKSLRISDEWLLSGSADQTIKLWSLKNHRVLRTFDMHSSSVWSLYSQFDDFRVFYSGDRDGFLYKTDLRGCTVCDSAGLLDESDQLLNKKLTQSLGVVSLVAKQHDGIHSIVVEGPGQPHGSLADAAEPIWCASKSNEINSYTNPDLRDLAAHQAAAAKNTLISLISDGFEALVDGLGVAELTVGGAGERSSFDVSPRPRLITSESIKDTIDNFSDNLSFSDGFTSPDDTNAAFDGFNFETCFVNLNGTSSNSYIILPEKLELPATLVEVVSPPIPENLATVVPFQDSADVKITGNPAVIGVRILNDRRTIVTLNNIGTVEVWNLLTNLIVKRIQGDAHSVLDIDDDEEYDKEMENRTNLFESVISNFQTKETLPNWCQATLKIGQVFINMAESSLTDCEVYVDELEGIFGREFAEESEKESAVLAEELRVNLGKVVLWSLFHNLVMYIVDKDQDLRQDLIDKKTDVKKELAKPEYAQLEQNNNEAGKQQEEKPPKSADSAKDEGGSTFKKFARFGRKKNDKKESNGANGDTPEPGNPPAVGNLKLDEADCLYAMLTNTKYSYLKTEDVKQLHNSAFKLPSNKVVPLITCFTESPGVTVLVSESSANLKGNYLNLDQFSSKQTDFSPEQFEKLTKVLPRWIGDAMLLDQYTEKPVTKINFLVQEWDDEGADAEENGSKKSKILTITSNGHKKLNKLPPLLGTNSKLSAYQGIRVKKIMFYILEKLLYKTPEMKRLYTFANAKHGADLKLEDWLEVLCNGEVLPANMTLVTIKTKIWKNSGDVILKYRRKVNSP